MAKRATALTAAAGEHYVAYKLSHLGYPVAMTRGGSPTVDLMVGDISGNGTVSIQIKTSSNAWFGYKKNPKKNHWLWDVGIKSKKLCGENIVYAFVDLKGDINLTPDVFIVPSKSVADYFDPQHKRHMFPLSDKDGNELRNNWELITKKLGQGLVEET